MNLSSYRRRVRRLEREVKPKGPLRAPGTCVSMTFKLYEDDPGLTWDRSQDEDGEPAAENTGPKS